MNRSISLYRKVTGTTGLMIVGKGLTMMSSIIYARYLGPEQFGLYSFVLSIITMATLPVIAGLHNLLVREVASLYLDKKWAYLTGIINWSRIYVLIISLVIIILMYFFLYFDFFKLPISDLLWMAVFLIPLRGMLVQQGAILNGFRQPILAQLPVLILSPVIILVILGIYIYYNIELTGMKLINVSIFASIIAMFISSILLNKTIKSSINKYTPKYKVKNWHSSLLPFTLIVFIGTLNTELVSVLLGWLVDNESVAYFKVAMQGVTLITLGLTSVNAVIMPNVARLYKQGNIKETQYLLTKSVRLSALFSLPIIFILIIFGEFMIDLLFGREYLKAYPILVILSLGQLVNVLMGSVGLVLGMTGNEDRALKSIFITFVLNLILLATLIPLYGALGAATAVSVSLVCWNVLMAINVKRLTKLTTYISLN